MNKLLYFITISSAILITFSSVRAQETPEATLQKASEYYLKGDFNNAVKFYTDYLNSYPQNIEVLNFRGLSYMGAKNYNRAIEDFSSAIGVKRSSSMSYVYRAGAYLKLNNLISAKKDYEDALFYDVENIEAYYGLNYLYVINKQYERSIKTLDKPIALEPKSARGYFMKALTYTFMKDTNKIFENVSEGLSWDSTYFLKYTQNDLVFVKADRFKYAVDAFTGELRMNPDSYLLYFNRGMIYYMMGSYEKAVSDLKKSLSLNKKPTESYLNATNKLIRSCYRVD
jgi:tetratricopeptide (TPR) repeat protein